MSSISRQLKVLYVAHEGSIDGSNTSLRLLISRIKATRSINEIVLVPTEKVAVFYRQAGLTAEILPFIYTIPMIELEGYGKGVFGGFQNQAKSLLRMHRVTNVFLPILKTFQPDIVHFNEISLILHARISRNMGFPTVIHDRAAVAKGTFGLRRLLLSLAWRHYSDSIITICPSYVPRLSLAASKATVIHNPFDIPVAPSMVNLRANNHLSECRMLLIGARSEKGLFETLQAMQLAKACKLDIAGQADSVLINRNFEDYRAATNQYHQKVAKWLSAHPDIAANTSFLGARDGIQDSISNADIVLIPWTTPHFARPLIEAWLMKKPVIATDVDGVAEYCRHGINSLIVKNGDIKALADAINAISSDFALRRRLGENGYAAAVDFIGANDAHQKVLDIYDNILMKICGTDSYLGRRDALLW